jgi:hypothetical protein
MAGQGQARRTRDHRTIQEWAQARHAMPATAPGTEDDDRIGVLRFDFPGYGGETLAEVSWDEWFDTFDERGLEFIYQESTKDGRQSNLFRLTNGDGS